MSYGELGIVVVWDNGDCGLSLISRLSSQNKVFARKMYNFWPCDAEATIFGLMIETSKEF